MSESEEGAERAALGQTIGELGRNLSTLTIFFHQAVAMRLGLGPADHKCLEVVLAAGGDPVTPGHLAEVTGLTTGAITGVLDRLEGQGFVRREKAKQDRRQVLVVPVPERIAAIEAVFQPFAQGWMQILEGYSMTELRTLHRYMTDACQFMRSQTIEMRTRTQSEVDPRVVPPSASTELTAPLGSITEAVLEIRQGVQNLDLGATDEHVLYRGRFEGVAPSLTEAAGKVRLSYRRSPLDVFKRARDRGRLELNRTVRWRFELRGGGSHITADLTGLDVGEILHRGGSEHLTLLLGRPSGTVPIHIRGGAVHLRITRPLAVPVYVEIRGGASHLKIDSLSLGAVGGKIEWASPDYEASANRYEIKLFNGIEHLTIAPA